MAEEHSMESSETLTQLRLAALALWKHQKEERERTAAEEAAERAVDVFGDVAGSLADPKSWRGDGDGDAVALGTLDPERNLRLEYDHTFDEQLWLRSGCPSCGKESCRVTPVSTLLELGQALDRLEEAGQRREEGAEVSSDDLPGACDYCDGDSAPADQLYQAVLAVIQEAGGEGEEESED
jgi:hypothetical protein